MYVNIWFQLCASLFFPTKKVSHNGKSIEGRVRVLRKNITVSFEPFLCSSADFSDKVPKSTCGHHFTALCFKAGRVRTGLSKTRRFSPKASPGQLSWPSNKAYSKQGRKHPIRFSPRGLGLIIVLHEGRSIRDLHLSQRMFLDAGSYQLNKQWWHLYSRLM